MDEWIISLEKLLSLFSIKLSCRSTEAASGDSVRATTAFKKYHE
jgi:hypothetical protein